MQSGVDRALALVILLLLILGSVFVFSSSYYFALRRGEDTTYYLFGHLKRVAIGLCFFLLGFFLPYERIKRFLFPAYIFMILLLVFTLIFGRATYGAKRSIPFATFGLQISEFVRVWIVFFLAHLFATHPEAAKRPGSLLFAVLFPLSLITLVAVQPSISVAVISFFALVIMLIYGEIKIKFLTPVIVTGLLLFLLAFFFFPHIRERFMGFLNQPGYQVQQSLIAIGSGGLFGRGPGAGLQKFLFLPRIHNDFIFAHIAEETGFIGCAVIFILYWEVYLRGITIANGIGEEYPRLVVQGLNGIIFIIFLIHVGVSLGLLPATGIPLPFVSYGGWALCANLFSIGMILQISKRG